MISISFEELCGITGGELFPGETERKNTVTGITTELMKVRKGVLFCCLTLLPYAAQQEMIAARLRGASAVLGEVTPFSYKIPFIRVSNVITALQALAEAYRGRLHTKIIGITGSVGKTTTKEMLASVLARKYRTYKTPGNLNSQSGVPACVLNIREEDEFAVLEMGISEPGEMERLSRVVRPDISVILNIGEVHLEGLGDLPSVLREKSEIFTYMPPDGMIFLNRDDALLNKITGVRGISPVFFSRDDYDARMPFPGEHFRLNAAAAAAVTAALGFSREEIAAGIAETPPVPQRCYIEKAGTLTLISDFYNANPVSMKAAIDLLCEMPAPRTAILGDMLELGSKSEGMHREIGAYAASKKIDQLVFIGSLARSMYIAAKETAEGRKVRYYEDVEAFVKHAENLRPAGGTVLVKASRKMAFETVRNCILNGGPCLHIEYGYNPKVQKGTVRYISQDTGSNLFYEKYWPAEHFGEYTGSQYESGTACCCMALSYLGVDVTPEVLLGKYHGREVWNRWGTGYRKWTPDGTAAAEEVLHDRISRLVSKNGKYSPVMIHVKGGTRTESGHYMLIVGKKSDKVFYALDPAGSESTALAELTMEGLEITGSNVKDVTCPIDEIHQWFFSEESCHPEISFTSEGYVRISSESEKGIVGLYLFFDLEYGKYTILDNDTGEERTAGEYGYLHEYLDFVKLFGRSVHSVTLIFHRGSASLCHIKVISEDGIPDSVQRWEPPLEGCADMALFSAHGDDDQLFFAGLLPLYAGERNCAVQVIYLTDHRNITDERVHEILDGLWEVGVRNYPVFGRFEDFRIDDLEQTYAHYEELGTDRKELLQFVVTQIRRFRPKVAVGHDLKGEYGHGMHMMYADLLTKAYEVSNDESVFPESAKEYGIWSIPKLYLHLYEKNRIIMDYDQPLEKFGGLTAFQVTQKKGYPCHSSQQWTWFTSWLYGEENSIEKAAQIEKYSPCCFGLYNASSTAESKTDDMMENIIPYAKRS